MAIRDILRVNRKTFFNPRGWLGYDYLKAQTLDIWGILRGLFVTPIPERSETYSEALKRLHLSDEAVQETGQTYFTYSLIFFVLGSATFVFGWILLFYFGTIFGWFLSLPAAALFLAQAFRFNFWYFQIKHRKLGCTFAEWKEGKTSEEQGPAA